MSYRRTKESPLERLEREANDDFRLLAELGPADFTVEHLLELRERARHRLALFDRRQRIGLWFGGAAAGWAALAVLAGSLGFGWLALGAGILALPCFFGFFAVILSQKRRFESRGELEFTLRSIDEELRRRGEKWRKTNP